MHANARQCTPMHANASTTEHISPKRYTHTPNTSTRRRRIFNINTTAASRPIARQTAVQPIAPIHAIGSTSFAVRPHIQHTRHFTRLPTTRGTTNPPLTTRHEMSSEADSSSIRFTLTAHSSGQLALPARALPSRALPTQTLPTGTLPARTFGKRYA